MDTNYAEHADVIIVGSGPVGSTYARILLEELPGASILMIEAGPVVTKPPGSHVCNIVDEIQLNRALVASQGPYQIAYEPMSEAEALQHTLGKPNDAMLRRPGLFRVGSGHLSGNGLPAVQAACNVGGMGSQWSGACPRPANSERIQFIDPAALDQALDDAESLLKVSQTPFPSTHIMHLVENRLGTLFNSGRKGDRCVQPMPIASTPTASGNIQTGGDVILGEMVEKRAFALKPETVCQRIIMDGDRARGVVVWDRVQREKMHIAAGTIVIAADSLHTPQLLFASDIRPPVLGRYLNDHAMISMVAESDGVRSSDAMMDRLGDAGAASDRAIASQSPGEMVWIPYDGESFPFHVQIRPFAKESHPLEAKHRWPSPNPLLFVRFFLPLELQWENRVWFNDSKTDWLGRPAISLHLKMSQRDEARMKSAFVNLNNICHALGRPYPGQSPLKWPLGSSLHYQGTIRMGESDDGLSVCDRNSRVWNTRNLYVAGNGVIPTETAGNPTLTSVALAVLGARNIVEEMTKHRDQTNLELK